MGLFITGTNTSVGKTYVGALIARTLRQRGIRVGVYKPAASGGRQEGDAVVGEDGLLLWEAAGRPAPLEQVCPQVFAAPLAPHLAARLEGRTLDPQLLRSGLAYWRDRCQIVLVEGAGGLMSPLGDDEYVADLASEFGYPLVIVAKNEIGVINQTLQTLIVAHTFRDGLPVAGIVLNDTGPAADPSMSTNGAELRRRCVSPLLAQVTWQAEVFGEDIDWLGLARNGI